MFAGMAEALHRGSRSPIEGFADQAGAVPDRHSSIPVKIELPVA